MKRSNDQIALFAFISIIAGIIFGLIFGFGLLSSISIALFVSIALAVVALLFIFFTTISPTHCEQRSSFCPCLARYVLPLLFTAIGTIIAAVALYAIGGLVSTLIGAFVAGIWAAFATFLLLLLISFVICLIEERCRRCD